MPLRIKVNPAAVTDLLSFLRALGADAERQGADAIVVRRTHPPLGGEPAEQDEIELDFVLRVWARGSDAPYRIERAA